LSSQLEATLAGANCDSTYRGPNIGLFTCVAPYRHHVGDDESDDAQTLRQIALHYIDGHLNGVPAVVGARIGRVTGLFHVSQQIDLDTLVEKRERPLALTGVLVGYATEVAALAGIVILLRRRGPPVFPLAAMLAITIFTVAATYANDRFRATGETALLILAAVALEALRPRSTRQQPPIGSESE
jgi:hypothetical protein